MVQPRAGRRTPRLCSALLAVLLAAVGCGDDEAGPSEDGGDCIGAAGGSVAITDPEAPLYGVKRDVPAGQWTGCWFANLWYMTTFSTPNFPDGIEGYEGWLTGSVQIELTKSVPPGTAFTVPDSMYMELTFPTRNLVCAADEIVTALCFDESAQMWRVVMPVAKDASSITVRTYHHARLWTWGKVILHEVDFELYLRPALEELYGASGYAAVAAELERAYESVIAHDMAITCANLDLVHDLFLNLQSASRADLIAAQAAMGGACGVCDVTSAAFYDELVEYVRLRIQAFFVELLFVENGPSLLIQVWGFMRLCETLAEIEALGCDYPCFFAHVDEVFLGKLAVYYVSTFVVWAVEYAESSGVVDCSGAAPLRAERLY